MKGNMHLRTVNTEIKYLRIQRLNVILSKYGLNYETRCMYLGIMFCLNANAISLAINYPIPSGVTFDDSDLDEIYIRLLVRKKFELESALDVTMVVVKYPKIPRIV
jgi:hypothetical protein